MDAPPRPSDEPIMTKWLLTRYCLTGLYVGLATIGIFVQHYMNQGIAIDQLASWSQCGQFWTPEGGVQACTELFQGSGRMLPQTLALTTLVCMEMIKALSAVSVDNSIFRVGPQDNKWLLLGVSGPLLLHLFVLYSSKLGLGALGESFGMVSRICSIEKLLCLVSFIVSIKNANDLYSFRPAGSVNNGPLGDRIDLGRSHPAGR